MAIDKHLVLVDDEPLIRANYSELLERAGFRVTALENRPQVLKSLEQDMPDLVLLDIDLGGEPEGGFLICRELRQRWPSLPVIFLTGHDDETDRISGFRLGADDYITKDVSIKFLVVRIQALLDRFSTMRQPLDDAAQPSNSPLKLDAVRLSVSWQGEPIDLSLTQLWILKALVEANGRVLSLDDLMKAAKTQVTPNTITSHVTRIRKRFRSIDAAFSGIENVHGHGYRWVEPEA